MNFMRRADYFLTSNDEQEVRRLVTVLDPDQKYLELVTPEDKFDVLYPPHPNKFHVGICSALASPYFNLSIPDKIVGNEEKVKQFRWWFHQNPFPSFDEADVMRHIELRAMPALSGMEVLRPNEWGNYNSWWVANSGYQAHLIGTLGELKSRCEVYLSELLQFYPNGKIRDVIDHKKDFMFRTDKVNLANPGMGMSHEEVKVILDNFRDTYHKKLTDLLIATTKAHFDLDELIQNDQWLVDHNLTPCKVCH